MTEPEQNLVFFHAEKSDKKSINRKLARLYMNFFIINEIAGNEINAVYNIGEDKGVSRPILCS